ncbi:MAG: TIGR03905 family TSCPD domain-containing protein [Paludibacteraceae bacterium]|nr:TIGR03905 family TSCPD domain-containing protein [Paludibacteraceae bacterium]
MKELQYITQGTCSQAIIIRLTDDDIVDSVEFLGGCAGNTQGLAKLVKGMKAEEVINRLSGITCGYKPTSCPDQLACALKQMTQK